MFSVHWGSRTTAFKMEICLRSRSLVLILFYLAEFCPSSGQSETQRVQRIVGESYTFPFPVMKTGSLSYGKATIAMVVKASGDTALLNRFKGRLQWDSQTGLFTITDLTKDDEGEYKVQNNDGKISTFQLTVYKHVSKPTLKRTQNCSVLCSVENGREVTLSWYRGDERLNQTSSPDLNTSLSLPLVLEESNSTYSCEVRNPVSSQHHQLEITDYCSKNSEPIIKAGMRHIPVIPGVAIIVYPIIFVIFHNKKTVSRVTENVVSPV